MPSRQNDFDLLQEATMRIGVLVYELNNPEPVLEKQVKVHSPDKTVGDLAVESIREAFLGRSVALLECKIERSNVDTHEVRRLFQNNNICLSLQKYRSDIDQKICKMKVSLEVVILHSSHELWSNVRCHLENYFSDVRTMRGS